MGEQTLRDLGALVGWWWWCRMAELVILVGVRVRVRACVYVCVRACVR